MFRHLDYYSNKTPHDKTLERLRLKKELLENKIQYYNQVVEFKRNAKMTGLETRYTGHLLLDEPLSFFLAEQMKFEKKLRIVEENIRNHMAAEPAKSYRR